MARTILIVVYVTASGVFFFNDTATTEIYTLSLHDALPISAAMMVFAVPQIRESRKSGAMASARAQVESYLAVARAIAIRNGDRKSTRLNSSHANISYAVFCLKKTNTATAILTQ